MSLNNESCSNSSSDDDSFQSSRSMVFSSGRSSSPAWSRSSSMTSGTSAISSASSESKKKLKAQFGPITRPTTAELRTCDSPRGARVQQRSSRNTSPNPIQKKSKKKCFQPVQPKIVKPTTNMPQPQGWVTYSHSGPAYIPPVPQYPPPMMYYPPPLPPPPTVQMPMGYPMTMPCSVPMPMPPPAFPPMYSQPQARYVSVQAQYTYTWTYIDYV